MRPRRKRRRANDSGNINFAARFALLHSVILFKHVHVHILPRKPGDFEVNDEIYDRLAKHDRGDAQPLRSLEEMSAEAEMLRRHLDKVRQ